MAEKVVMYVLRGILFTLALWGVVWSLGTAVGVGVVGYQWALQKFGEFMLH